jgi:hypothetical protein
MFDWWTNATTLVRALMIVGQRQPAQRRTGALAQQLPGDQVRVVLHLGHDDLVAGPDPEALRAGCGGRVRQRVGEKVDRLGAVFGEHHLLDKRADECRDLLAGSLVGICRGLSERVHAAVRSRVVPLVELSLGIEHRHRLLGRRRRVQVDQRATAGQLPVEDREVLAQDLHVVGHDAVAGRNRS